MEEINKLETSIKMLLPNKPNKNLHVVIVNLLTHYIKKFIKLLNTIPKNAEHSEYIKNKEKFLNNIDHLLTQEMKNNIGFKHKQLTNFNISKVRKVQSAVRTKQAVQNRYVDALLNDMNKEQNFNYYINKINKVYRKIPGVIKHLRLNRSVITTQIAPCHIRPGQDPKVYLKQLRNQLLFAAKMYHQKKVRDPNFKKRFLDRLKSELGGRPCLENLIEGLSVALSDPEFVWKGRNIAPLMKNNSRYLNLLGNAVQSFQKYHATQKNAKNLPVSHQRRVQMFWNMIKNKNVHVVIGQNNIGYQHVKNYNINGARFRAANAANWLSYIGRKNEGTANFFRKKLAVKRIENAYKKHSKLFS